MLKLIHFIGFLNIYQNHNTLLVPEEMMLHVGNLLVLIQHFYTLALYTTCVIHTSTFHLFLSNIRAHLLTNKLRFPEDTLAHRKPTF